MAQSEMTEPPHNEDKAPSLNNRSCKSPSSNRTTPLLALASTPNRFTPSLKGSAIFQRTSSSQSKEDKAALHFRNLLNTRLLITQPGCADDDDEYYDYRSQNGRMSRDTDYETDLEMDYDEWIAEEMNEVTEDSSQETRYMHMCNQTGTIPVSYFLKHIKSSKFKMRYHGLGPLGAKALASPLKENHDVEQLDLEGNWIERDGAVYLADMLKDNMYLSEVNIAENRLGRDGADAICDVLIKNEFLKSLNMSGNDLQDSGATKMCEMLQKNSTLKHLYVAHNKFEEKAAFSFKEALSHNETLETLDLSWNHFRTSGAIAIAEGVQENYGLKSLFLSMNGFSNTGAEAMGKALKYNRGLTELDMSHNRIATNGAGHIAIGLQTNDTLKVLKLGFNPLGDDGPMVLIVAVSKNDVSCMTRLDLSDVFVTAEFRNMQEKLEGERIITIIHAGVVNDSESQMMEHDALETFRRNPFEKLKKYCRKAGYRLVDLFRDFDKDGSRSISRSEFEQGLKASGIKITPSEITILIKSLDLNEDGVIDYSELLLGDKEFRREMREEELCPDDRQMQRSANRMRQKRSGFIEDLMD